MVAGREVTPKDAEAVERLKRYWTIGPGAAKIRWGEPNDWYRCVAAVTPYTGADDAPGYCENLHVRATGMTTAEHTKLIRAGEGKDLSKP